MKFKVNDIVLYHDPVANTKIVGIISDIYGNKDEPYWVEPLEAYRDFSYGWLDEEDLIAFNDLTEIEKEFYGI